MPKDKDAIKKDFQKIIQDMDKAGAEAEKSLREINRKIAAIDLRYAKMLIKEEIDTLKTANQILENKGE